VEAVLPVAQGKVYVVPPMMVPEGKHASCPVGARTMVSRPMVTVEDAVPVLQG
jgi:hypothetical protein